MGKYTFFFKGGANGHQGYLTLVTDYHTEPTDARVLSRAERDALHRQLTPV